MSKSKKYFYYVPIEDGKFDDIYASSLKTAKQLGLNRAKVFLNHCKISSFEDLTLSVSTFHQGGREKRAVVTVEHIREDIKIRVYKSHDTPTGLYECNIYKNGVMDRDFHYSSKEDITVIIQKYLEHKESELNSTFEYAPYFKALNEGARA